MDKEWLIVELWNGYPSKRWYYQTEESFMAGLKRHSKHVEVMKGRDLPYGLQVLVRDVNPWQDITLTP